MMRAASYGLAAFSSAWAPLPAFAALTRDDGIVFEQHVLPILEAKCTSCHRAPYTNTAGRIQKPKGGLRLDSRAEMEAAVDLIVPKDAASSLLIELITLPADDPERMPQDAAPLSLREVEVLRRWMDAGADFGSWTGEAVGTPTLPIEEPARIQVLHALAEGLGPLGFTSREKAVGEVATIVDVLPGGSLVEVNYRSHELDVTDKDLQRLLAIKEHVTYLRLARTPAGDAAIKVAAKLPALTRLDLTGTKVTTGGLAALSGHAGLRYLNLRDTAVGDGAMDAIAALPNLESVYLFGTQVTEQGAARLRELRPGLYVQRSLRLPEGSVMEEDDG